MMGQLKKFSLQMAGGANIASIIVMLLIGYSGFINPVSFPRLSNIGALFISCNILEGESRKAYAWNSISIAAYNSSFLSEKLF